jgi:hypothetical protein
MSRSASSKETVCHEALCLEPNTGVKQTNVKLERDSMHFADWVLSDSWKIRWLNVLKHLAGNSM